MLKHKSVYLFGYSGHSYVIIETLQSLGYHIAGYFDYNEALKNPYNLPYLGFEETVNISEIVGDHYAFPTVGENVIREKIIKKIREFKLNELTIIDPTANVSQTATIGGSTYVGKNVQVNALAVVESGVILNTGSLIEHEVVVQENTHVAPSAVLLGNVKVGRNNFVGSNSVLKHNVEICDNVIIGAGSVVIRNITTSGTYAGNPSKEIIK